MAKKRKRSMIRKARQAIERQAESMTKAGVDPRRMLVRIGGQRLQRWSEASNPMECW